jgi:hypothetical protein
MGSIINKMIESGILQKAMPNPQTQQQVRPLGLLFNPDGSYPTDKPLPQTQLQPRLKNMFSGSGVAYPQTPPQSGTGFGGLGSLFSNFLKQRFGQQLPNNQITNPMKPPELTIDQINSLSTRDRLNRSLNLAGFGADDINRILASRGYADGGYVNTNLTRTIPPVRGPNPQGIQTLLARRYR